MFLHCFDKLLKVKSDPLNNPIIKLLQSNAKKKWDLTSHGYHSTNSWLIFLGENACMEFLAGRISYSIINMDSFIRH